MELPLGNIKPSSAGLARSVRLFRMFRREQNDPARYYAFLAADTVRQLSEYTSLDGRVVLDVGGGPGWFTAAFSARGARGCLIEPDVTELRGHGAVLTGTLSSGTLSSGAVRGDGCRLPVRDQAADVVFSSNVLEHVPDPMRMIDEMIRATRPGGVVYLSFTNWYSPWGGHELSPWHYLGAGFAEHRYHRRYGTKPKHRVGESLYRLHIGPVLRAVRARADVEILDARPRYYPSWCRPLVRVPGVRELATWNLLLVLRRSPEASPKLERVLE